MVYPGQNQFVFFLYILKNRNDIFTISFLVELLSFAFLWYVWVTAVSPKMILVIVALQIIDPLSLLLCVLSFNKMLKRVSYYSHACYILRPYF
jgi:hypothetical protein